MVGRINENGLIYKMFLGVFVIAFITFVMATPKKAEVIRCKCQCKE